MQRRNSGSSRAFERISELFGRSRFIVLIAVIAVMLIAVSLFLFGTIQAVINVWGAWEDLIRGDIRSTQLTVEFLEIVSVMLKAVIFYMIGVGLYSLFICPLNIAVALGVETLNDLESKVVSVVVVILGVTFLEHFISWKDPLATLQFGGAMALVIAALVAFQRYSHIAKEDQRVGRQKEHDQAQKHMFEESSEQAELGQKPEPESQTKSKSRQRDAGE